MTFHGPPRILGHLYCITLFYVLYLQFVSLSEIIHFIFLDFQVDFICYSHFQFTEKMRGSLGTMYFTPSFPL